MLDAELSVAALAHAVGVDAKSVVRWISEDRLPYPLTRSKVAHALGRRESFLWPSLVLRADMDQGALGEVEAVWAARSRVSSETWHSLFSRAAQQIDILVFAGGFLLETLDLVDVLRWKAAVGTRVRILVGDPASEAVKVRAAEISLGWLPDRCRTTLTYLEGLRREGAVDIRSHQSTLYASTFRFDDLVLVNLHAYGVWAAHSPVLRVHQAVEEGMFGFYAAAFERVWGSASCVGTATSAVT